MLGMGFRQYLTDTCLFLRTDTARTALAEVYVDDLLVTGTSEVLADFFARHGGYGIKRPLKR